MRLNESFKPHHAVVSPSVQSIQQDVLAPHITRCCKETREAATTVAFFCARQGVCSMQNNGPAYGCQASTLIKSICFLNYGGF